VFVCKKPKREKRREIRGRAILNGGCSTCVGEHEEIPPNVHYVKIRQRRHRQLYTEPRDVVSHNQPTSYSAQAQERYEQRKPYDSYNSYKRCEHDNKHTHEEDDTARLVRTAPQTATTNNEIITSKKHTYACHMWNAYKHIYK